MSIEPPLPVEIVVDSEVTLKRTLGTSPELMHALIHQNLEHLGEFLPWAVPEYSLDGVTSFLNSKLEKWNVSGEHGYSIFYRAELAGAVGISGFESPVRAASLGYWLSEHLQGNGIMTRSVSALIKLAFDSHDMNQVTIKAAPANSRSRAIPQRLGFTVTGTERQMSKNAHGELLDLVIYSLLRSEWRR